jgi:outer membrane protein OmpA-like peptidoglycan-associated protein
MLNFTFERQAFWRGKMRRSVWAIVSGLVLAILAAAAVAKIFGLPLAAVRTSELPIWHLLRTSLPIAAFVLPGALTAILLAEARRVRGLYFWLFIGALLAALAFFTLVRGGGAAIPVPASMRSFMTLMGMGLVGGWVYWLLAGKKSGHLTTALAYASQGHGLDENGLRKRCRVCTAATLLLGLLPLALLGWHMIYKPSPMLPASILSKAELDGTQLLAKAGMPEHKFAIENYVGHVTGSAADDAARAKNFETAKTALKPMLGGNGVLPSVVAYLQNDIVVAGAEKSAAPPAPMASPNGDEIAAKIKADEDARLAAEEAKRKADEVAAKAKAQEEARLAAEEAKRKADEATAKAKAEDEARIAAEDQKRKAEEAAAKAKAEEEARVAAEAKRKSDDAAAEAAAKATADEVARLAAEAKAKAAAEAEAAQKAAAEKLAAEAEAQRLRDAAAAAKKLAEAQAQAKAKPVEPPAPVPAAAKPATPSPEAQCASDFGDLFRSDTVRFALKSAKIDSRAGEYLDRIAATSQRCAGFSLSIGGHTDRSGVYVFNQYLGNQRAIAVRDALVARGVASERLDPKGYGSERPFDPANTRAAFLLNRRVDFGAAPTPPAKLTVQPAEAASAPASAPVIALPVDQCNAEFNRTFLADTVRFVGSSSVVTDEYAGYLDRIAALVRSCATHKLVINGHTDRRGKAPFNQKLSVDRANAVRQALIDRGVPDVGLSANGYAGERPFDPGNSPEAYALNRRVDFGVSVQAPKN